MISVRKSLDEHSFAQFLADCKSSEPNRTQGLTLLIRFFRLSYFVKALHFLRREVFAADFPALEAYISSKIHRSRKHLFFIFIIADAFRYGIDEFYKFFVSFGTVLRFIGVYIISSTGFKFLRCLYYSRFSFFKYSLQVSFKFSSSLALNLNCETARLAK